MFAEHAKCADSDAERAERSDEYRDGGKRECREQFVYVQSGSSGEKWMLHGSE
jgi:hypothetical protein